MSLYRCYGSLREKQLVVAGILCLWVLLPGCVVPDTEKGADSNPSEAANCSRVGNATPRCGFPRPEDLAFLPGHQALLVSEYGDAQGSGGAMSMLLRASAKRTVLFQPGADVHGFLDDDVERWGDSECVDPPGARFSPHGIDLAVREDGRLQLLVVQHGDREAIELFEVSGAGESWRLQWRGCVPAPQGADLNSVAAGSSGDFYTTKMMPLHASELGGTDLMPTEPTGLVYHWSPRAGYRELPATAGIMPNGIVFSEEHAALFINYSGESTVKRYDLQSASISGSATAVFPDNIKWDDDRTHLLVASLRPDPDDTEVFARCMSGDMPICPVDYAIMELDPKSMEIGVLFENGESPMGAGTVGVRSGNTLYVGSFAGNRMLQVELP